MPSKSVFQNVTYKWIEIKQACRVELDILYYPHYFFYNTELKSHMPNVDQFPNLVCMCFLVKYHACLI